MKEIKFKGYVYPIGEIGLTMLLVAIATVLVVVGIFGL